MPVICFPYCYDKDRKVFLSVHLGDVSPQLLSLEYSVFCRYYVGVNYSIVVVPMQCSHPPPLTWLRVPLQHACHGLTMQ